MSHPRPGTNTVSRPAGLQSPSAHNSWGMCDRGYLGFAIRIPEERLSPSDSDGEHLIVWSLSLSELAAGWVNAANTTQDHGHGCAQGTRVFILRSRWAMLTIHSVGVRHRYVVTFCGRLGVLTQNHSASYDKVVHIMDPPAHLVQGRNARVCCR